MLALELPSSHKLLPYLCDDHEEAKVDAGLFK